LNDQSRRTEPKDPRVEAALRDYLERVDGGKPVDREEFLARHAPIADQLRSFIAAEEDVRKLAAAEAETPHDQARDSTKSFVGQGQETVVPQLMAKRNVVRGLEGRFGRYRIIRALGKGAMGTVYLAEDTQIERQVALKTPHFTEDPTGEQMVRFFREARAAGNLRHPHICPIYDFGQIDGRHFISMAYIEGRPLSAFIQPDNQQPERQILLLVRKLALALQEAHDQGVVHRDLKPANIMVDKKGEPIIMDFGLAQQTRRNEDVRLTQTGNILGTPAFMSPEQVEGEPDKIGPSTDQYSLGVILYELLTGELPFRGSIAAVMGQILTKEPLPPSQRRPDLDARIEAVCLKMMAKNPAQRFRCLKAASDEISSILKSPAAKAASKEQPASPPTSSPPGDPTRADAGASQVLKSLKQKTLTEKDLESLEELARKCYSRRDFEQVIQIIERIPEKRRNAALRALLEKSREKADEVSFLICDIDGAERLNDRQRALKKADELLKIKPGHHRAREIQEKFAGYGAGGAARIGLLKQFTQPWHEGGWIPWSALAFGLAVFGVMAGVIIVWLGRTAVVIDVKDPGITVEVNDRQVTINVPGEQSIKVEPGAQLVKISYAGLETVTKSFTLDKGKTRRLTVKVLDNKLVADLEGEIAPPAATNEEKIATAAEPTLKSTATLPPTSNSAATLPPTFKNSLGMEFVLVPKGKSWLGGGGGTPGDKPVVIAQDFYLDKYEVTQEEWEKVTGVNPSCFCRTGSGKDQVKDISNEELKLLPVEQVSWDHAQLFLQALNEREKEAGWQYRLPKEAEWEYACRGGPTSSKFDSAYNFYLDKPTNQLLPKQANFWHGKGLKRTCKVGSYQPNRLGLYDMHGNAHEWCDDSEQTADGASRRVHRGGGWNANSEDCRAARRGTYPPSARDGALGLRVARVPVGKEVVKFPAGEKQSADLVPNPAAIEPKPNVATAPTFSGRPSVVRGEWRIENDELVQPTLVAGDDFCPVLIFGEETLSNYDLTLEAKETSGVGQLGVTFHILGPGHYRAFYLWGNREMGFSYHYNGIRGQEAGNRKELSYSSNRWYSLKIEARGDTFRAYLDDVLQLEQTDARFTHGRICLYTSGAAARFRRIKVSDAKGKVLFEGLPDLAAQASGRTESAVEAPALEKVGMSRAETNQKKGEEFLAANAKKKGVRTLPSGLQYVVVKKGTGKRPKETDEVEVHYRGTLIDGTVFDNSLDHGKPVTFRLNRVIPGWTESLQLMKEGSKWRVYVPSKLAYRQEGVQPNIGPNETLIFEIELLHVK